jgi:polyhydroxybutyrate depolymerase
MESGTGFDAAADKAGFLAVYPAGLQHSWNDLRTGDTKSNLAGVDDVAFVSALIDQLVAQDHADPARIYATGMSNGGMFTETLGCKLADKLAAIAPVSGTLPSEVGPACAPAKPIPVLEIHGTADPIVPFDGGHVAVTSASNGMRPGPATILSVAQTQQVWRDKDHCTAAPATKKLPDTAADGTAVTIDTSSGCANGTSVVLYTVTNGGHTWPGGSQYLPVAAVGRVTKQFSATDVITDFFTADIRRK